MSKLMHTINQHILYSTASNGYLSKRCIHVINVFVCTYLRASRSTAFHITQESSARMMKGQTSPAGPPPSTRRLRSSSKLWYESSLIRKWAAPVRDWGSDTQVVGPDRNGWYWHFRTVCVSVSARGEGILKVLTATYLFQLHWRQWAVPAWCGWASTSYTQPSHTPWPPGCVDVRLRP